MKNLAENYFISSAPQMDCNPLRQTALAGCMASDKVGVPTNILHPYAIISGFSTTIHLHEPIRQYEIFEIDCGGVVSNGAYFCCLMDDACYIGTLYNQVLLQYHLSYASLSCCTGLMGRPMCSTGSVQ